MTDPKEVAPISVETARALLRHVMEWDSEESTCAGWISDNEYRLWCQVARDPVVAGEVLDLPQYAWLRELAAVADGWWVWPHEAWPSEGPWFLNMSEWLPIYEEHRQTLIGRYGPEGWAARLPAAREENRAYWQAFREEREAPAKVPKAKAMGRETAAARLLKLMEDEAEDTWASSWVPEHEYMLWAGVVGDDPRNSYGASSEPARLEELAKLANGWFTWNDETDEVEFVPMGRWLLLYRQYAGTRRGEPPQP
jgi:hypothetical protein